MIRARAVGCGVMLSALTLAGPSWGADCRKNELDAFAVLLEEPTEELAKVLLAPGFNWTSGMALAENREEFLKVRQRSGSEMTSSEYQVAEVFCGTEQDGAVAARLVFRGVHISGTHLASHLMLVLRFDKSVAVEGTLFQNPLDILLPLGHQLLPPGRPTPPTKPGR